MRAATGAQRRQLERVTVRSPASSANLGPGFDCVGLALDLHTTVRARRADAPEVVPLGAHLQGLPRDRSNVVYAAMELAARAAGLDLPPLRVEVESDVPLARGLGSSAAALVAGLVAGNELLGGPLTRDELLDLAAREEGHPDNVGACLLGGVAVATLEADRTALVRLDVPDTLGVLLLVPDFELKTSQARAVLPGSYSRADTVHALSHAALLAAALATGDLRALGAAMQDRLHQPQRAPLVPGLSEVLAGAAAHGAVGAALSGAGPSVLCLYDRTRAGAQGQLREFLEGVLRGHGLPGRVLDLRVDHEGTIVSDS